MVLLTAGVQTIQNYERRKTNKWPSPFLRAFEKGHENQYTKCVKLLVQKTKTKQKREQCIWLRCFIWSCRIWGHFQPKSVLRNFWCGPFSTRGNYMHFNRFAWHFTNLWVSECKSITTLAQMVLVGLNFKNGQWCCYSEKYLPKLCI